MSTAQSKFLALVLATPPGIVIALHAYLGSFTRLVADDYCTYYYANRLGALRAAWYWYLNFTGVYARSLLNEILLLTAPNNMWVIVPGTLVLWIAITAWVFYLLLEKELPSKPRIWISLASSIIFVYIVLLLSPQPTQSLYWWGGFSAYTAPLVLSTCYLAIFLVMTKRMLNKIPLRLWSLLSFLMAFGLGGISESYSPTLIAIIAFALVWELITKKLNARQPVFWFLTMGLIGSMLALIVMISAPGNAIRMAYFPPPPRIINIVQISIKGYLDFLKTLLYEPQKTTAVLGVIFGAIIIGLNSSKSNPPKGWVSPAILSLSILFAFLCFPPAAYGTSEPPPARVLVIPSFILAGGLLASGYMSGKWFSSISVIYISTATKGLFLATVLLMSFSVQITSRDLYESRSVFIDFANKWDQVDLQIRQAMENGEKSVTIPAMDNWAGLERPTPNKEYWPNVCYSLYYDIQVYGPRYSE